MSAMPAPADQNTDQTLALVFEMRNDIAGLKSGVAALQMQGHEAAGRLNRIEGLLEQVVARLNIDPTGGAAG